jgi:gamma-glutamyl hydrolase
VRGSESERCATQNDDGDYFPVWGTCLGHEWLLQIIAEDIEVLDHKFDAWNISLPLHLSPAAFRSTLIRSAPRYVKQHA